MDAKQLEKMMGFAPGELEKAAEAYEKDGCRRVAPSSWEGRRSLMSQALFYRHVWVNRSLKPLTQKQSAMGKHARSNSESSSRSMQ